MTNRMSLKCWHVATASLIVAALLMFLVHRFLVHVAEPASFLRLVLAPSVDWGFMWYPILSAPALVVAYVRRSLARVVAVQAMLFAAGFVHVLWIVGTVPVKIDWRPFLIVLTGHAVAWTTYLCAAAALAIGLRR